MKPPILISSSLSRKSYTMKTLILLAALASAAHGQQQATVTIYRTSAGNFAHQLYRCDNERHKIQVFDGFERLVHIKRGRFATLKLSPGEHTFRTKSETAKIDLAPGGQYFLRPRFECNCSFGKTPERLEVIECVAALPELADLTPVEEKDLGAFKGQKELPTICASPKFVTEKLDSKSIATQTLLKISSSPDGAAMELDGNFVGNTPSSIAVSAGQHRLVIKKLDFKVWEQKLVSSGGEVNIKAELERELAPSSN